MLHRCPTCDRMFDPTGVKALPFCSPRCRLIDLGRWYGEKIGIPVQPSLPEDDEESQLPEGWDDIVED